MPNISNKTLNTWISYIQEHGQSGVWNVYDGYKQKKNNNQAPVNLKHKSVFGRPNRVLHFEIKRSTVKITTHVIYSILSIYGEIKRIVVYKKFRQIRAFVEFSKEEYAIKVLDEANNIILDYLTLEGEYAKPSSVTVLKNNDLTWDYTKSPLLDYVNGVPTLKSIATVLKDSPRKNNRRPYVEDDNTWELVENFDFIRAVDDLDTIPLTEKSKPTLVKNIANSTTREMLLPIPTSEQFAVLSVRGFDPTKSNCNQLFRLLSMYSTVAKINFSRELNSAEVQIGKCKDINSFAQIQQYYLSHGLNLSLQYLKGECMIKSRSIDPFVLSDGSPSYVIYDRKITDHVSYPPSRVLKFHGAPPSMNEEKLISLLNRSIKVKDFKVKVYSPIDSKKDPTVNGEIWFTTPSEAIEVIMAINYAIFWNKDTGKKEYMLKLSFISDILPKIEPIVIKTEVKDKYL